MTDSNSVKTSQKSGKISKGNLIMAILAAVVVLSAISLNFYAVQAVKSSTKSKQEIEKSLQDDIIEKPVAE
jgi:cell division protein FtsN